MSGAPASPSRTADPVVDPYRKSYYELEARLLKRNADTAEKIRQAELAVTNAAVPLPTMVSGVYAGPTGAVGTVAINDEVRSVIIKDREAFTSDVAEFDAYARLACVNRKEPVYQPFWEKLRELMVECSSPCGLQHETEDIDIAASIDPAAICKFMARYGKTALLFRFDAVTLSGAWNLERDLVLTEVLHCVRVGMLSMQWRVPCKVCSSSANGISKTLAAMPQVSCCEFCGTYTKFTTLKEAKCLFTFKPAVYYAPVQHSAGARIPSKIMQTLKVVVPIFPTMRGNGYRVPIELPKGKYRMYCSLSGNDVLLDVNDNAGPEVPAAPIRMDLKTVKSTQVYVPHGKMDWTVWPTRDSATMVCFFDDFKTEDVVADDEYFSLTTAEDVFHNPVFNQYFATQLVSLQNQLEVSKVFIAFTDLTDSTKQYSRLGDGVALKMVQDHFEIVFKCVAQNFGRVVKTVGDAVMASYIDGGQALRSMVDCLIGCREYTNSAQCPQGGFVSLKIGLHVGHAIVVPLNGVNDYFGQTVNIAARVQGLAAACEIVVSGEVYADHNFQRALQELQGSGVLKVHQTLQSAALKGVESDVKVARLSLV